MSQSSFVDLSTKIAFITGITGQDGSYLAEFLLSKKYIVHGLIRRTSNDNKLRIYHLLKNPYFFLHFGDVTDSLHQLLSEIKPNEIYNLAAVSFVQDSFDNPKLTHSVNSIAVIDLLETVKSLNLNTKIYKASTSEMFGNSLPPQNEKTLFSPRSPYAISKLAAYWHIVNYRNMFGIYAVNGILFNHESPKRGDCFVTKKICSQVAAIQNGYLDFIELGNLDAKRDWGHAKDYVYAMWLMLQQEKADDYVISTGISTSVRDLVQEAFSYINMRITWLGESIDEVGVDQNGIVRVKCNVGLFRPNDVEHLEGDFTKAKNKLGWEPKISFNKLIKEMMEEELSFYKT
jgi:GDPmannose 4,6-dehydratase